MLVFIARAQRAAEIVLGDGIDSDAQVAISQRIMDDKAYLESVYRAGAEKAGYVANKTLRKVYKKIGFVER